MSKKHKKKPVRRAPGRTLYHGGAPGLRPGDRLRPAAELRLLPAQYEVTFIDYDSDPNYVYLTSDRRLARSYAAKWTDPRQGQVGQGDLYEVTARGPLGEDPDYPHRPGLSVTAAAAVVVRVLEQRVRPTDDTLAYAGQFSTWEDGAPMYDRHGYALPSTLAQEIGITAADLRHLGRNPVDIEHALSPLALPILERDAAAREAYLRWHRQHSTPDELRTAELMISALPEL